MSLLYYVSYGIFLTIIFTGGIITFSVEYTKYQVRQLQKNLEEKINLNEEEKILLQITKDYLEKVK